MILEAHFYTFFFTYMYLSKGHVKQAITKTISLHTIVFYFPLPSLIIVTTITAITHPRFIALS